MRSVKMSGARGMPVSSWKRRAMTLMFVMLAGGSVLAGLAVGPPASAAAAPPGPAPGVTMSAAAQSASTVYLAYTATNGAVYVQNAAQPGQAAIALGGRLIGGPTAVMAPQGMLAAFPALVVFGRGTDNALWWRHQTGPTGHQWSSWQSLGGILSSAPGAAAGMTGQFGGLNVFVRGTDGVIWYRVFGGAFPPGTPTNTWGPWTSLGGAVMAGTGPGADSGLFAIANPDRHVSAFGRTGTQYGYADFGGLTTATPGITEPGQGWPVVFARGLDNALWYRPSVLPIAPTGSWASLGGRLTSGVTATTVPGGKTYVFALGTDNNIWMRMGTWPSLGGWMRL